MELDHCFYLLDESASNLTSPCIIDSEYEGLIWRPGNFSFTLPGMTPLDIIVWQFFHYTSIFQNTDFSVFLVHKNHTLVHHSFVFPKFFRYPFMNSIDLQIGNTWTHPDHRCKGLACYAIQKIVNTISKPGRRFWYVVEKNNYPSIRVIEKCHFKLIGEGIRSKCCNLRLLGAFIIKNRIFD
jgi:RimJ/RimL family protein N-acetyltransferase